MPSQQQSANSNIGCDTSARIFTILLLAYQKTWYIVAPYNFNLIYIKQHLRIGNMLKAKH